LLYTPLAASSGSTVVVTAAYLGEPSHSPSSGTITLTFTGSRTTTTTSNGGTSSTTSSRTTTSSGGVNYTTTGSPTTTSSSSGILVENPGIPPQVNFLAIASLSIAVSYLIVTKVKLAKMVLRRTTARVGLALSAFILILTLYGLFLDPYAPRAFPCYATCGNLPPFVNLAHLFGTYPTGQDVFSEVAHGAIVDLTIGFEATAVALLIGTLAGLLAGSGMWVVRDILLASIQIVLLLPSFVVVVWIYRTYDNTNLFLSPLLTNYLALLLGLFAWPPIAIVVSNSVKTLQQQEFVAAARALGAGKIRVVFRHIFPNVTSSILSIAGVVFAANITAESLFAFLGLVNKQSDVVTWGFLLWEGDLHLFGSWWIAFFPGLMIFITVLGFSLIGDAIAETMNPKVAGALTVG
jgi:peptide/nickel transport system permease protein